MDLGIGTLLGGLVSGFGSLFGANQSAKYQLDAVREQNKANLDLANLSYERDLDMWNRQNAYNSPSEQISRLVEAGLNPNLMYGSGSSSTGNASSMPQYKAPHIERTQYNGDFGISAASQQLGRSMMDYAQYQNIQANTKQVESNTRLTELKIAYQGLQNSKSEVERDFWFDYIKSTIDKNDSQTVLNNATAKKTDVDRFFAEESMDDRLKQAKYTANKVFNDWKLSEFDLKITPLQAKKLKASIAEIGSRIQLNMVKGDYMRSQIELNNLEKEITQRLINDGVDVAGKPIERLVNSIIDEYDLTNPFAVYGLRFGGAVLDKLNFGTSVNSSYTHKR